MSQLDGTSAEEESFPAALESYRRLRLELAECERSDSITERLLDDFVCAEERIMAMPATDLMIVLVKFEIAMSGQITLEKGWVETIRNDLMRLGGLEESPLSEVFA